MKTPAKLAKERLLIQSHVMKVRAAVTISARKAEQSTDDNTSQQFELGQSIRIYNVTLQKKSGSHSACDESRTSKMLRYSPLFLISFLSVPWERPESEVCPECPCCKVRRKEKNGGSHATEPWH